MLGLVPQPALRRRACSGGKDAATRSTVGGANAVGGLDGATTASDQAEGRQTDTQQNQGLGLGNSGDGIRGEIEIAEGACRGTPEVFPG